MEGSANKRYIKSLIKAMSVLKSFNTNETNLSVYEIAKKVGTSKPTAHRILTTLAYGGLLEKNKQSGKYTVGPVLYSIGTLYLETASIFRISEQLIKVLGDMTEEAITLAIRDRDNVTFVMIEEAKHALRLSVRAGSIVPAHCCAIGRALLSDMTPEEIDVLYPKERLSLITEKTVATRTELKLELDQIKKNEITTAKL
jgi:DNA-binding IclR family transcriptional regulator